MEPDPNDPEYIRRQRDEAIRALRRATGLIWDETIAFRARPDVVRETCTTCQGSGKIDAGLVNFLVTGDPETPRRCGTCGGNREIWKQVPLIEAEAAHTLEADRANTKLAKERQEAKEKREQKIAMLCSCTCSYPSTTYRNGSGHHSTCPAHAMWLKATEHRR
jgi:hypothetical protein